MKILLTLLFVGTTTFAMETNHSAVTLPGSAWRVTSLGGQTPLPEHPITFAFDAEGNISGDASCNQFGGTCTIEGKTIKVGPLRSTRRACEPEVMQQEQKFLTALGAASGWEIDGGGLVLRGEGGEIRAERHSADPEH